jgi:hypothetical protein
MSFRTRKFLGISLGLLALVVAMIAFAVWLFYFVEDARGSNAWASTLKQIRDAGEPATLQDLIPPPIPDEQNLAALPLFRLEPDYHHNNEIHDVALEQALELVLPSTETLPLGGNWMFGRETNFGPLAKYIAERYRKVIGQDPGTLNAAAQIDAVSPALADLRLESRARPHARFDRDYISQPVYNRPLGPITLLIKLTKAFNLHALAALSSHQADVALDDIEVTLKLEEGSRRDPILISGLVAVGDNTIQLQSFWQGLHDHAWTDPQLARLQDDFSRIDFLADFQLCLRGEGLGMYAPMMDYLRDHRDQTRLLGGSVSRDEDDNAAPDLSEMVGWLAPRGWFDMIKADGVRFDYRGAREPIDLAARRVYPEKAKHFIDELNTLSPYSLSNILLRVAGGPIMKSAHNFSDAQARADMAEIACALERFRLAHGTYPKALDALDTRAPHGLPHDPITGDPYIYRLRPDGTYLLYSVGWNQVDDGGKIATKPDGKAIDSEHGDLVWPCPDAKPLLPEP